MIPALVVAVVALAVIAWLCWHLSRIHSECSSLCRCIADMLTEPKRAEAIADKTRRDLISSGLWRSG